MNLVLGKFLFFVIIIFSISCTRDMVTEVESDCGEKVTYENQIRPIINTSCSYTGCHSGTAPGDFTSYETMSNYFESEIIENRVIIIQNMPPIYATGGPVSLSMEELDLFKCWIDSGYPEN